MKKEKLVTKIVVSKPNARNNPGLSPKSVIISERQFNEHGIQVGTPKIAPLAFDPEVTDFETVFAYAQTRKWKITGEPNQAGLYVAEDIGPKEEETSEVAAKEGELAQSKS